MTLRKDIRYFRDPLYDFIEIPYHFTEIPYPKAEKMSSTPISYTEAAPPVKHTLHVFRDTDVAPFGRVATAADLVKAGFVPSADLEAAKQISRDYLAEIERLRKQVENQRAEIARLQNRPPTPKEALEKIRDELSNTLGGTQIGDSKAYDLYRLANKALENA